MTDDNRNREPDDQEKQEITPATEADAQDQAISISTGEQIQREEDDVEIPEELPILPLRGVVMFPYTAIPLTVGQPRSIRLIDDVAGKERLIGLVAARDPDDEQPGPDEIYTVGTVATVHRLFRAPDGTIRLLVQGLSRIKIEEYTATEPYLIARVSRHREELAENIEVEALTRNVVDQFSRLAELVPSIPTELISSTLNMDDPLQMVYAIATYIRIDLEESQAILEIDSVTAKLRRLMDILNKELEVLELGREIQSQAQSEMEKVQREYFLREQLKAIQRELGEVDEQQVEIEEFRSKIDAVGMAEEAEKEARRELDRMAKLPTAAAEYGVIRTYLDWLVNLPWSARTEDNLDIAHAREVLDTDHYGLEDIKERILEFLAVRKLRAERTGEFEATSADTIRREREGAILCFVGPPGVGKTSLGSSIARAMGRKFIRMSLGGIRDEAEIRGFRRTYIGAMPGRIIQTLRRAESRNPVIMLDEVDKLGHDFRGDPSSALLEVLDPEQNHEFRDHYIDVAFDLSEVLFITTANELEPIPGPLRDRMEIITLNGYIEQEKVQIALRYLVPRQIRENGLRTGEITYEESALREIIHAYTREAGVRELERQIGQIARKVATHVAEAADSELQPQIVTTEAIRELLGKPRFDYQTEIEDRTNQPGIATGLAYTPMGGDILFVEAASMPGSNGFQLTGQLGSVMQESARAALSYVRSRADQLGVSEGYFEKHDIHLHVPAGAVPKDGPSAGVTMATALASLLTGRAVQSNVAMTGEITLRGKVLPVGGIKAKVLAAHRSGLDTVILPRRNEQDLDELPDEVRETLHFVLVSTVDDVLEAALAPETLAETLPTESVA
jgi:ATP-dependent Lon protease